MGRSRFAQAAVVLALGGLGAWTMSARSSEAPVAIDLFQRLVVAPGDDPSLAPLAVGDARLVEIDRTGALVVHGVDRVRRQQKPRAFQERDGRRLEVPARFEITAAGEARLVVGPYDHARALVVE